MTPHYLNPLQWTQSLGLARQVCARVFRDGGSPVDAFKAFGLAVPDAAGTATIDWAVAVDRIAQALCVAPVRKAA
jgi:hypothetical protein